MKTLLRFIIPVLMLPIAFWSCTKEAVTTTTTSTDLTAQSSVAALDDALAGNYTTYVIQKGKHFANGTHFPPFSGTSLTFKAVFNETAMYDFSSDPSTYYDQNTLYGFADDDSVHHSFSARFGWRWFNGELQIAAYTFNNGIPTITQIGTVKLGKPSTYAIIVYADHYDFILDGDTTSMPRASTTPTAGPYKLLPYFGGDATAPHKVGIKIMDTNTM